LKKNELRKIVEGLNVGDLVCCEWCDASVGKSRVIGTAIDVPVKSWGIYMGLYGEKTKHVVLAQNCFRYSDGIYDLDYTALPLSWAAAVKVLGKEHIPKDVAIELVNSFLLGGHRGESRTRIFQQRKRK